MRKQLLLLTTLSLVTACGTELSASIPTYNPETVDEFNVVMDANRDRQISLEEILNAPDVNQHPLHFHPKTQWPSLAEKYIALLDKNQDGILSFEEASGEANNLLLFEAQDINKDGVLTRDELSQSNSLDVVIDKTNMSADDMMTVLDTDKNQQITREEFLRKNTASGYGSGPLPPNLNRPFTQK